MLEINRKNSLIKVEKISLRKRGVIILTGPSSCGKGEVANALCNVLSIKPDSHLSMGDILRNTFSQAKVNEDYAKLLKEKYELSQDYSIFNCVDTNDDLTQKVMNHIKPMEEYFQKEGMAEFTSQIEWLEYCTMNGLLVPNRWTQNFVAAHIEHCFKTNNEAFILDGYPRTVKAAEHLLEILEAMEIPVLKVLHLSISKQEMIARAASRGRGDDDEKSLHSRFNFYVDNVQPSIDYLKTKLGGDSVALIDAHQPVFAVENGVETFNLRASINKVVSSVLISLGIPRVIIKDLV